MMNEMIFWLYLANSILLINHEIESAYWHEWKLFKLPGDISGFLAVHFPLLFLVLYGLILVYQHTPAGLAFSLLLSFSGLFAFTVHMYFLKQGRPEFRLPISITILVATLAISLVQGAMTLYVLM